MPDLTSRPFRPTDEHCCERCAFGSGAHTCKPMPSPDPFNFAASENILEIGRSVLRTVSRAFAD